ncbi:MAG: Asp-tRNA(Asn)/Glu-tRNA(Gln) amidotransferase subunit GatC [Alphaproteobacteria bacterium]|nr:Asp-tRNA(Asn)/Glu-tRNA(Gln) amidotransferase subunit GatC [Alphaproteobacteria bacterium]
MAVDGTTIRRIARLAHIAVTDEEVKRLEGELSLILQWCEQLDEVNTDDVPLMNAVIPMEMKRLPDVVDDSDLVSEILSNAPCSEGRFLLVPKVFG